jgi:hypothetical protein
MPMVFLLVGHDRQEFDLSRIQGAMRYTLIALGYSGLPSYVLMFFAVLFCLSSCRADYEVFVGSPRKLRINKTSYVQLFCSISIFIYTLFNIQYFGVSVGSEF